MRDFLRSCWDSFLGWVVAALIMALAVACVIAVAATGVSQ